MAPVEATKDVKLYNIKRSLDHLLERGKVSPKVLYLSWGMMSILVFFGFLCGSSKGPIGAVTGFFAASGALLLIGGGSLWAMRKYFRHHREAAVEDFNRRFPQGSERRFTAMNLLLGLLKAPKKQLQGVCSPIFLKDLYTDLGGTDLPPETLLPSDGPPLLNAATWKPLGDVMAEMVSGLALGQHYNSKKNEAIAQGKETDSAPKKNNASVHKEVIQMADGSTQTVIVSESTTTINYDDLPQEMKMDYLPKDLPIINLDDLPKDMQVQTLPDGSILLPYPNQGADYLIFGKGAGDPFPLPPPVKGASTTYTATYPVTPSLTKKKIKPKSKPKRAGVELVYDFIPLDLDPHKPEEVSESWDSHSKELLLDCFCGAHLKVPVALRGKKAKCSKCDRTLEIPS